MMSGLDGMPPGVDIGLDGDMGESALAIVNRAEIDVQISTAHRYPRSMQTFKRRAIEMATLDEETAASCMYSRDVGGGKYAQGMSVRMAEIVGACYGNLRVGAMIIEQTERYVKARGFAHDLETNFASASEVIESCVDRHGNPFKERMRVVVAKAAVAKARRDATFQVVPKALCKPVEAEARRVAIGDASTLQKRRSQAMEWIGKLGVSPARVFAAINVGGEADIGLDQLATLTGLRTAIRDGEITVDDAFPQLEDGDKSNGSSLQEKINAGKKNKPASATVYPVEKPADSQLPIDEQLATESHAEPEPPADDRQTPAIDVVDENAFYQAVEQAVVGTVDPTVFAAGYKNLMVSTGAKSPRRKEYEPARRAILAAAIAGQVDWVNGKIF